MTSEGQYAGSQPAEATSGGPTSDGFPPESDGQRVSGRAAAQPPVDGFPSSYAPPPQATPNGGSPFVVPAVQSFGHGPESSGARPTGTSYGSARVPQPDDGTSLPQRSALPPAGDAGPLPQRVTASPYGPVSPDNVASPYGPVSPTTSGSASPASPFGPASAGPASGSASTYGATTSPAPYSATASPAPYSATASPAPYSATGSASLNGSDSASPYGSAAGQATPFGSVPDAATPFGSVPGAATPFGSAADAATPFGSAAGAATPFGSSSAGQATPYGSAAGQATPFGSGPDSATPFGSASPLNSAAAGQATPYGSAVDSTTPFGAAAGQATPFGSDSADPYGSGAQFGAAADSATPFGSPSSVNSTGGGSATPFGPPSDGPAGSASPFASAAPGGSEAAWAPTQRPGEAESPFGRSDFPLPQRNPAALPVPQRGTGAPPLPQRNPSTPPELVEFDGFAAGNPGRGLGGDLPDRGQRGGDLPDRGQRGGDLPDRGQRGGDLPDRGQRGDGDPATRRPPGISAFGDQRVRVPGATLSGLPDMQPLGRSGDSGGFPLRASDENAAPSAGFPLRGGGNGTFPVRRGDSGGFPVRSAAGAESEDSAGELPIRSQQAPFGTQSYQASAQSPDSQPFPAQPFPAQPFTMPDAQAGTPPGAFNPFGSSSPEDAPHPYARAAAPEPLVEHPFNRPAPAESQADHPYGRPAAAPADNPYGRATAEPSAAQPFGMSPIGDAPATQYGRPPVDEPYGRPALDEAAGTYGRQPGGEPSGPYGRPAIEEPPQGLYGRPAVDEAPDPFGRPAPGEPSADQPFAWPGEPSSGAPASPFAAAPFPGAPQAGPHPGGAPAGPLFGGPGLDAAPNGTAPQPDEHALYRRPGSPAGPGADSPGLGGGYPQRVPGAALGSAGVAPSSPGAVHGSASVPGAAFGSPVADSRSGSVPQPRDPAERPAPAVGSARPVTASASVPSASRVAPADPGELAPPPAAPQARVYGRPALAEDEDGEPRRDLPAAFTGGPEADQRAVSPFGEREDGDRPTAGAYGSPAFPGSTGAEQGRAGGFGSPTYPGQPGSDQNRPLGIGSPAYQNRSVSDQNGAAAVADPGVPGAAPQSPARATARATASARVAPPSVPPAGPDAPNGGPPFNEFTTDVAGRGERPPFAPEPYSEHTTDIAGRGEQQPYVPAPALPAFPPSQPLDGERPRMGGVFPGPATRATVTPPSPDDTTNWPAREQPQDQTRLDQRKPDVETVPAKPETPHVRMLPILLAVVVGAGLLVGLAFGVVYLVAGHNNSSGGGGFSVSTGDCVKKSGTAAVKADCSDASSYKVVSIVDDKSKCADPQQPYVLNPTSDGKTQVLCLKSQG